MKYDEISPLTGNMSVIVEPENGQLLKLCMESGYHTYSTWKVGSDSLKLFEQSCPDVVINAALFDDESDLVWYPITMMTEKCWLYPDKDGDDICWKVSKFVETDDESISSFASIKVGNKTLILDPKQTTVFNANEFQTATDHFYKVNNEG